MAKSPGLILISGNVPALLFDLGWGIQPTASYLIRFSGPMEQKMRAAMSPPPTVISAAHGLHVRTGAEILYNRDVDLQLAESVLKNSELARARHLSLSFWQGQVSNRTPDGQTRGDLHRVKLADEDIRTRWLHAFFGNDLRCVWICPPVGEEALRFDIKHYRLFCDERWMPAPPVVGIAQSPLHALGWHLFGQPEQTAPLGLALPAKGGV